MISAELASLFIVLFMLGLLVQACIFRVVHDDLPSTYKLFAVRDRLIRLVIEGQIERHEPHFEALYENVNTLLRASRCISGPDGWKVAHAQGKLLARKPEVAGKLQELPSGDLPGVLHPVSQELRSALLHLLNHHLGVLVQWDSNRRELARIQQQQARDLLRMMPRDDGFCAG